MTVESLVSPVARIVWGNPAKPVIQKDLNTKQDKIGKDGQPVQEWGCGLAFTKEEFNQLIWPHMAAEAATIFPNGVPSNFSWKFVDGDTIDKKGNPYSNREGYAGCIVLTVKTVAFAPDICKNENGAYRKIDPSEIKTGDYVRVDLNFKANAPANSMHTPGMYVNPNGFELVGYGNEIVSQGSFDAQASFGGQQVALPAGASATPTSPVPTSIPTATPAAAPVGVPPTPAGAQIPAAAPVDLPPPAADFVANAQGNAAPVAATQPQQAVAQAPGVAQPATTSPTNALPGMPEAR